MENQERLEMNIKEWLILIMDQKTDLENKIEQIKNRRLKVILTFIGIIIPVLILIYESSKPNIDGSIYFLYLSAFLLSMGFFVFICLMILYISFSPPMYLEETEESINRLNNIIIGVFDPDRPIFEVFQNENSDKLLIGYNPLKTTFAEAYFILSILKYGMISDFMELNNLDMIRIRYNTIKEIENKYRNKTSFSYIWDRAKCLRELNRTLAALDSQNRFYDTIQTLLLEKYKGIKVNEKKILSDITFVKRNKNFNDAIKSKDFITACSYVNYYLNEGNKDYAAILSRILLERILHEYCFNNNLIISEKKGISKYADILYKHKLLTQHQWRQIKVWVDIGNAAAHGRFEDFSSKDITKMVEWTFDFISEKHLSITS